MVWRWYIMGIEGFQIRGLHSGLMGEKLEPGIWAP